MKNLGNTFGVFALILLLTTGCSPEETKIYESSTPPVPTQPVPVPTPDVPDAKPAFVGLTMMDDMILIDLNTLSDVERLNTRYLVSCNEYNGGAQDMAPFLAASSKFLNSISTESTLEPLVPVGVASCLFRLDLRDFGISFSEWRKLESLLLLDFVDKSIRGQQIRFLTNTNKPYIFGADGAITALGADLLAQNGLYYDLIDQPIGLDAFFDSLGVNVQREFDDEEAVVGAFSQSQIALGKTRSVQTLESDDGFVVTSYDSALSDQDSHFVNPFPLEAARAQGVNRSNKIFDFAAQEHIFSLPNGMLGFRLNGSGGNAETFAPNDVVINLSASGQQLDPTIYIGSCYACHSGEPFLKFRDQLSNHIAGTANFDALEKDLGRVFFDDVKMEARLRVADTQHRTALARIGSTETGDGIHQNLIYPLRKEQNAQQVAGYLAMPVDEFLQRLAGSGQSSQIFGNLLNGGTIGLAALSANFNQLVVDVGAFKDDEL